MLVLTRKPGQTIRIGDDIEITVVEIRGEQVRIGIQAPRVVSVLRGEVVEQVQAENREAAATDPGALDALVNLAPQNSAPPAEDETPR